VIEILTTVRKGLSHTSPGVSRNSAGGNVNVCCDCVAATAATAAVAAVVYVRRRTREVLKTGEISTCERR
jgi:hypothetical protein